MKARRFLLVLAALSAQAALSQSQLQSHTIGGTTYTTGTVDGKPVSYQTYEMGGRTYTRGRIGDQDINTSSHSMGGITYTSGTVGNQVLNTSASKLGGNVYTRGRIGNQDINTSSHSMGGTTYTSGRIGNSAVNGSSYSIGGTTHTRMTPSFPPCQTPACRPPVYQTPTYQAPIYSQPAYRPAYQQPALLPPTAGNDIDQPMSFHSGGFSQPQQGGYGNTQRMLEEDVTWTMRNTPRRTWEDMRRDDERKLQRELEESPIAREMYREFMQRVGKQYMQQVRNTFGPSYNDASACQPTQTARKPRSYFRWILLAACLAGLCKWLWRRRREMPTLAAQTLAWSRRSIPELWKRRQELLAKEPLAEKRALVPYLCAQICAWTKWSVGWALGRLKKLLTNDFWDSEKARTSYLGAKIFAWIRWSVRWSWGRLKRLHKRIPRGAAKDGKTIEATDGTSGLNEQNKPLARRILRKWLRAISGSGQVRMCRVCGAENHAKTAFCSKCGVALTHQSQPPPRPKKKKGWFLRKGPYSRLRDRKKGGK